MKYKLLVLDVDGTLLNDAKEISKRTLAALLKVQQMGVRIVLASGRPTYGLMPLAKMLELGNYGGFILSYNGCQIINAQNGEILFERRINPEMLPYLEKKARKNGFALFTYHDDTIITDSPENEHIQNEARLNNLQIIKEEEFSAAIDFAPCKCMLVSDDEEALLGLEDSEKQLEIAEKIAKDHLSVREVEKLVKNINQPAKKTKKKELSNDFLYHDMEEKVKLKTGTKVKINRKSENKGKIEIEYYSQDDLEKILGYFK